MRNHHGTEESRAGGLFKHMRAAMELRHKSERTVEAYLATLGISDAAVTTHVTSARQKLGLRSRAELAAFFQPSGVCARLAEALVCGQRVLIGSRPLCDNPALAGLTPSEREVVTHVLCGSTNQDIARRRGTSQRTIANQVQTLFRKLRVQSRVELAILLQRAHWSLPRARPDPAVQNGPGGSRVQGGHPVRRPPSNVPGARRSRLDRIVAARRGPTVPPGWLWRDLTVARRSQAGGIAFSPAGTRDKPRRYPA